MRFAYRRYEVRRTPGRSDVTTTIFRPMIPIHVRSGTSEVMLFGLLDTGADTTVLPGFVAQRLGVNIESTEGRYRGVGGQVVTVSYGKVTLGIGDDVESYHWESRVAFLEGRSDAILGNAGLLEYFDVTFRGSTHDVVISRNSSTLPAGS